MIGYKKGFTLVELIVVITILSILGTIAFVSFQGYTLSARDSTRINDIKLIEKGITLFEIQNNVIPLPDNLVNITASGSLISYQGYVGTGVLSKIKQAEKISDPLLDTYYTYGVSADKQKFQLLGYFEKLSAHLNKTMVAGVYASSYNTMYPRVFGSPVGILLNVNDNSPLQTISHTGGTIDIANTGNNYQAYLSDEKRIFSSDGTLLMLRHTSLNELDFGPYLVGRWDMESSFNDILVDLSGNNKNLSKRNNIEIGTITGQGGTASEFDGVNEYFSISGFPSQDDADLINNFSISAWIYPRSYKTLGTFGLESIIFSKSNSALGTVNYAFQVTDENTLSFFERSVGESLQFTNFAGIPNMSNKWTHVAFTFENNLLTLYINGKIFDSKIIGDITTDSYQTANDGVYIGGTALGGNTYFDGYIDDIRIYSHLLSEGQIEILSERRK